LRGTAAEATAIKRLIPGATVLTALQASEEKLKSVKGPIILHIATHGFFLADPEEKGQSAAVRSSALPASPLLRGGLAFVGANARQAGAEDGLLTGLEASGLDLLGTQLVVSSACDTGVGEISVGEGVFGLRRAFTLAGAESLVMSLWPVSDQVTRELMVSFYSNLTQGMGRGEALRRAKLEMLRRPTRRHPFYWASFIQSGSWTEIPK
jgi:CHAT domain-containing protein